MRLLPVPTDSSMTIHLFRATVAIAIETLRFVRDGYASVLIKLVYRLVTVDATKMLANRRVRCKALIILKKYTILNAPKFAVLRCTPLKQYIKMVRDLFALLTRR